MDQTPENTSIPQRWERTPHCESGTLLTLAVVIVAVIVSLGHWTIIRIPAKRRGEPVRTAISEEAM